MASTNELYLENQAASLNQMSHYLDLEKDQKEKLKELMLKIKDNNDLIDKCLDYFNGMTEVYKSLALFHAIDAMLYEIRLINPNELNNKLVVDKLNQVFYDSTLIEDSLKDFAKKHLHIFIQKDFDFKIYIDNKIKQLEQMKLFR